MSHSLTKWLEAGLGEEVSVLGEAGDNHTITALERVHGGTNLFDNTYGFVANAVRHALGAEEAVVDVEVRAADGRRGDAH